MKRPIRVVAIGASAGGLEPIEQFFDAMSNVSGFAFVIIQHLSPDFDSLMDQLISRHSKMEVLHARDGLKIRRNSIYLTPPRTELTIRKGVLRTRPYSDAKVLNMPINLFFESLAEDFGEEAIGIVMSGTGSDGTLGGVSICERGGTLIAQEPASAKFDSMPRKVIEKCSASFVALPKDMPDILKALASGLPLSDKAGIGKTGDHPPETLILSLLEKHYGTDFGYYKETTVSRRIRRRAFLNHHHDLNQYFKSLSQSQDELEALYRDLLIGVTRFFRDWESFEALEESVLPELMESMTAQRQLRIWVAGCASGEEAYSIAILFSEYARQHGLPLNLKVFATDVHFKSLEIAAAGLYSPDSMQSMPDHLVTRYFERHADSYQVKRSLRRLIVFSPHNLIKDPPFTRMDMVSCRNLIIYLNDIAQRKVMALFHFALRKKGVLFLGPSETVGSLNAEFTTLDKRWRIFQKKRRVQLREATDLLPLSSSASLTCSDQLPQSRSQPYPEICDMARQRQLLVSAYDQVLEKYAPTGLLINRDGELIHVFGNASNYLKVQQGEFSNKVAKMVREELQVVVSSGIDRALTPSEIPFRRQVTIKNDDDTVTPLSVGVESLTLEDRGAEFLLITIEENKRQPVAVPEPDDMTADDTDKAFYIQRVAQLESELNTLEESLQNTIEELETSNEELQATNEELMSSNEELQSTNEELHSVNEELYTVSAEHQRKIEELMELTDDMDNLLRSTEIGTIFLDKELRIRRFTPSAAVTFNLLPHDIGRPLEHVTYRFAYPELLEDISKVLNEAERSQVEISVGGNAYLLSILPYKIEHEQTAGVVLTIVDVQDLKQARNRLASQQKLYENVVQSQNDLICRMLPDTSITFVNNAFCGYYQQSRKELVGTKYIDLVPEDQRMELIESLNRGEDGESQNLTREDIRADGSRTWLEWRRFADRNAKGRIMELQLVGRDITQAKQHELALNRFHEITSSRKLSSNQKFDAIVELAAAHFHMPVVTLSTFEGQRARVMHRACPPSIKIAPGDEYELPTERCKESCDSRKSRCYGNFANCKSNFHPLLKAHGLEPAMGVQITIGGHVKGALTVANLAGQPKREMNDNEAAFLELIGQWSSYEYHHMEQTRMLEDLNQRLRQEEERFRQLYLNTPVIMHSIDAEGRIIEASEYWLKSLGYSRDEVIGHKSTDFLTEQSQAYAKTEVLPKFWTEGACKDVPYQMIRKDGSKIDVRLSATLDKQPDGRSVSLAVLVDVTDQILAEKALEEQNRELKRINDNLKQFTHIVSHDLTGPLRAIQHTAHWIEEDTSPETRQSIQEHIDRLNGQIAQLSSMIADLTQYSRAGNSEHAAEQINLREELNDIFSVIDGAEQMTLSLGSLPRKLVTYRAPLMLVFRNLLENSVKYHDRKDGRITVKSKTNKDYWHFSVQDDGIGIDPKYHDKILLPFRKLERKDKVPGNGMGLALVKKAIESNGGSLRVESDPARAPGTTFLFDWPKGARKAAPE